VVINNASSTAIIHAQKAFEGAAKDFGVDSEEDAQRLVDEIRYGEKTDNESNGRHKRSLFRFALP